MDAIISVDADQRIVLFNAAAEQVFRCAAATRSEIPRTFHSRAVSPQHATCDNFARPADQPEIGKLGMVYGLRADGEQFPIEASISQVHFGGEHIYTIILRDITDRLREEATLRRQVELLHLSHDAIFAWSDKEGIRFWSKGAAQLYGTKPRSPRTESATNSSKTASPANSRKWNAAPRARTLGGRVAPDDQSRSGDGHLLVPVATGAGRGNRTVILETDRDITERRRLEQEVLEIIGAEQRRIGQDLHDGLCQHLTGIEFRASVLTDKMTGNPRRSVNLPKLASSSGKERGRRGCFRVASRPLAWRPRVSCPL